MAEFQAKLYSDKAQDAVLYSCKDLDIFLKIFCMKAILFLIMSCLFAGNSFAASLEVKVNLIPTGNFYAKTEEVSGKARRTAKGFEAKDIIVQLKSLKSGVSLRDEHIQKQLLTDQFPVAELKQAKGVGGKGVARISIRGKTIDVKGSYKEEDGMLIAKFSLPLASIDMSGIKHMNVRVQDIIEVTVSVPIE